MYTGKSRETKRRLSKDAGLEQFNGLMVDVYRDRGQANGANFDNIFRKEMIKRYGKQNNNTNPARGEDKQTNPENCVVVVYSDFNMEQQLMAHATAASAVGAGREAPRGQQGNNDDDDADEVSRVMV